MYPIGNPGWVAKSKHKKIVIDALQVVTGGDADRMLCVLEAILRDGGVRDAARRALSDDRSAPHPLSSKVQIELRRIFNLHGADDLTAIALANAKELLQSLSADRFRRVTKEGVRMRRTLLSAFLPSQFTSEEEEKKWRRFLGCRKKQNLGDLQTQRADWLSGKATSVSYNPGRKPWLSDKLHEEWRDAMLAWLETGDASRCAPGKYNLVTDHWDDNGIARIHNHSTRNGRNGLCNLHCISHPLHWKVADTTTLHLRFLERHAHIDPRQFTRQRFAALLPYWLKPKPREVCACPPHKQAGCLLDGYRRAVKMLHRGPDGTECECKCKTCADGLCSTYLTDFETLCRAWFCDEYDTDFNDVYHHVDEASVAKVMRHMRCTVGACATCSSRDNEPFARCPLEIAASDTEVTWSEVVKEKRFDDNLIRALTLADPDSLTCGSGRHIRTPKGMKERINIFTRKRIGKVDDQWL